MIQVQFWDWSNISPSWMERTLNWFVMSVDSRVVLNLEHEPLHDLDYASLRLIIFHLIRVFLGNELITLVSNCYV